jgi:hypothetical protein
MLLAVFGHQGKFNRVSENGQREERLGLLCAND